MSGSSDENAHAIDERLLVDVVPSSD